MLAAFLRKPLDLPHAPPFVGAVSFMNRLARLAAFALVLLLFFIAVLAVTQQWLKGYTERTGREMVAIKEAQFDQLVALAKLSPPPWSDDVKKSVEAVLGATITVSPASGDIAKTSGVPTPVLQPRSPRWEFVRNYPSEATGTVQHVHVRFAPSAVAHLISLYQQCAILLLFLALGLLAIVIVAVVFSVRARSTEQMDDIVSAGSAARGEINNLTQLAKVSARQSSELERERIERQRAEEDAHFQQTLLNRALEEKIRLGHDLHDGIIQSLYAAGLTVEAAKNLIDRDPEEASRQLDSGVKTINTTIREVRGYIAGLSPESLRHQTFAESIRSLTQTLDAGRAANYDLRIDDAAAGLLNEEQIMHLLQIAREAISNGLRHGGASHITVRLHQSSGELCLLVQDNGKGFAPETASGSGHGLVNMRARVERLGGSLQFSSSPGAGTKLIVTLQLIPSPAP
jgi:signal transduction histidine kinase